MSEAETLRAMARNYRMNNLWDHLDAEACTKAANKIDELTEQRDRLLAANRDCLDHFNALKQDYDAIRDSAAVGNWLCNYMASEQVDRDDYLVEACFENNPVKFKEAVIAAMEESEK